MSVQTLGNDVPSAILGETPYWKPETADDMLKVLQDLSASVPESFETILAAPPSKEKEHELLNQLVNVRRKLDALRKKKELSPAQKKFQLMLETREYDITKLLHEMSPEYPFKLNPYYENQPAEIHNVQDWLTAGDPRYTLGYTFTPDTNPQTSHASFFADRTDTKVSDLRSDPRMYYGAILELQHEIQELEKEPDKTAADMLMIEIKRQELLQASAEYEELMRTMKNRSRFNPLAIIGLDNKNRPSNPFATPSPTKSVPRVTSELQNPDYSQVYAEHPEYMYPERDVPVIPDDVNFREINKLVREHYGEQPADVNLNFATFISSVSEVLLDVLDDPRFQKYIDDGFTEFLKHYGLDTKTINRIAIKLPTLLYHAITNHVEKSGDLIKSFKSLFIDGEQEKTQDFFADLLFTIKPLLSTSQQKSVDEVISRIPSERKDLARQLLDKFDKRKENTVIVELSPDDLARIEQAWKLALSAYRSGATIDIPGWKRMDLTAADGEISMLVYIGVSPTTGKALVFCVNRGTQSKINMYTDFSSEKKLTMTQYAGYKLEPKIVLPDGLYMGMRAIERQWKPILQALNSGTIPVEHIYHVGHSYGVGLATAEWQIQMAVLHPSLRNKCSIAGFEGMVGATEEMIEFFENDPIYQNLILNNFFVENIADIVPGVPTHGQFEQPGVRIKWSPKIIEGLHRTAAQTFDVHLGTHSMMPQTYQIKRAREMEKTMDGINKTVIAVEAVLPRTKALKRLTMSNTTESAQEPVTYPFVSLFQRQREYAEQQDKEEQEKAWNRYQKHLAITEATRLKREAEEKALQAQEGWLATQIRKLGKSRQAVYDRYGNFHHFTPAGQEEIEKDLYDYLIEKRLMKGTKIDPAKTGAYGEIKRGGKKKKREGRFKKGSKAAKEYMAYLRSLRKS